jgi:hypothetical protein
VQSLLAKGVTMSSTLGLILGLNAAAVLVLGTLLLKLRAQVGALHARSAALPGGPAPAVAGKPGLITIEILNPVQVATQRHWVAGVLGTVTPDLIRAIVQRETAKILREELKARGVEAEVRIEGA